MSLPRRVRSAVLADPAVRALAMLDLPRWRLAGAVGAGSLALGCAVGLAATSAWLIARAAEQPPVLALSVAVVCVRALGLGRGVFRYVERLVSHDVALRGVVDLREGVYRRLAAADTSAVARLRRGDLLARLGADVDALADLVVRVLLPALVALVTGLATVVLATALLPAAGAVLAAALLVAGVGAPLLAGRAARAAEVEAADARGAVAAESLAVLDGADELAVAGQLTARQDALASAQARLDEAAERAARPAAAAKALVQLALGAAVVGSLVVGVPAASDGALSAVHFVVVALLPLAAFEGVAALPAAATSLVRCRAAAARVLALVDGAPTAAPVVEQTPDGTTIRARGLSVGWPGAAPVLTGLDLDLEPGATLAITGPSGCGKTTLLLTLAGLIPPVAGTVTVGGVPVHELSDDQRRGLVALAAEDGHLFATTLRENLRLASGAVDDAVLLAALGQVGLAAWATALPEGLGTVLGSAGTDVSGGERRRLLVARALLTGAPVVLLDEPAEHLDAGAATAVLDELLTGVEGRTVAVATHRSDRALADAVVEMAPAGRCR
ncbi:thiol reductant ABC exporter subunit CydC [uncultured Pseudokineococcus sp.]|uniref:thiol reductant ABC exporter subunit CydC n=1 Tax=uncultured Pseudokineococcus sp. TaxID=1642928 RepID=UPI002619BF3C|nr:thiol reductant ABC exporter subunit CydC [uncultured Pseudokineococcus sp.]